MRIIEILNETPLPDDLDKGKFVKKDNSFKSIINYAKERAKRIGSGSSRVAFIVQYQGRKTVLKIAKNNKGIYQNRQEIDLIFKDEHLKSLGIVIPGIDYDENDPPMWLHVEKANKMNDSMFKKIIGISLFDAFRCARYMINPNDYYTVRMTEERYKEFMSKVKDKEFINALANLLTSYKDVISITDIEFIDNWGVYKGKPVIVDIGFGSSSYELYDIK